MKRDHYSKILITEYKYVLRLLRKSLTPDGTWQEELSNEVRVRVRDSPEIRMLMDGSCGSLLDSVSLDPLFGAPLNLVWRQEGGLSPDITLKCFIGTPVLERVCFFKSVQNRMEEEQEGEEKGLHSSVTFMKGSWTTSLGSPQIPWHFWKAYFLFLTESKEKKSSDTGDKELMWIKGNDCLIQAKRWSGTLLTEEKGRLEGKSHSSRKMKRKTNFLEYVKNSWNFKVQFSFKSLKVNGQLKINLPNQTGDKQLCLVVEL